MSRLSIARKQSRISKKIRDCQITSPVPTNPTVLHVCREYRSDELEMYLGDAGISLFNFSHIANLDHPDILKLSDGRLADTSHGGYSRIAIDALRTCQWAECNSICPSILMAVQDLVRAHPVNAWVARRLNSSLTRFVADRAERRALRSQKRQQRVFPTPSFTGPTFENAPEKFDCYERGYSVYLQDVVEAEKKRNHFLNLNLPTLAGEIDRSIERIKLEMKTSQCHGFCRIDISIAAMILAKVNGYEKQMSFDGQSFTVRAPKEILPDFSQWADGNNLYGPRLYPYTVWWDEATEKTKEIIDFLEEFPELNGNPLFDNYWVLVPGINRNDLEIHYMNQTELLQKQEELDKHLVKQKNIIPILLGERDGEIYFICYWM